MKRFSWLALAMVVALGIGGCKSSSSSDTGPVNPDDLGGTEGIVPADDGTPGEDVPPQKECQQHSDCAAKGENYGCDCNFDCVPLQKLIGQGGCLADLNCGSEAFCDPCDLTCKPLLRPCEPCERNIECEGGANLDYPALCTDQVEINGNLISLGEKICAPWCPKNGQCAVAGAVPGSYICADIVGGANSGVCVPFSEDCTTTGEQCDPDATVSECAPGEKCWADLKVCGCVDSLSCDFSKKEFCHPKTHRCVEGCTDDNECGSAKVCASGQCVDPCTGTLEDSNVVGCNDPIPIEGKDWDCDEKGHCFVPGMCFSPTDCREKEFYCDGTTRTCQPGCLIDFDCKSSAKICDAANKACVDRGCSANYWCSCGEVCDLSNNKCKAAEGKYCDPCVQKQQESDPEPCGEKEIVCLGFKDPDTNEDKGSYCMPPCGPDPENPCPQGWQCQELKDQNGQVQSKNCIRFCYQEVKGGCAIGQPQDPDASPETATISDP